MGDEFPLISCVMPTSGRPKWAQHALNCAMAQTYPRKEIVILDDMNPVSFENITYPATQYISDTFVRYYALASERSIPVKRNTILTFCKGEFIAHFDSDDWSDAERLMLQYRFMKETGKAVVGFHSILMAEEANGGQAFKFNGPYPRERYCLGTSLLYTKAFWQSHPFDEKKTIGSDVAFIEAAYAAKELATIDGGALMVARIHEGNTSKKRRDNCTNYQSIYWNELPKGFRNLQ